MNIHNSRNYLLAIVTVGVFAASAFGQNGGVSGAGPQATPNQMVKVQNDGRQKLLTQLGLSRDQIRQLRMLNQGRRAIMEAAQLRVREATKFLDDEIYNVVLDEADVDAKVKDLQLAQAEITKLRATNEVAVRKILTADQLVRFRELRDRFEQNRQDTLDRRQERMRVNNGMSDQNTRRTQPNRQFLRNQNKP